MPKPPIFRSFDIRLAVSHALCSTPTTLSVYQLRTDAFVLLQKNAYSLSNVVQADAQKLQKLNVINYKHEYMR